MATFSVLSRATVEACDYLSRLAWDSEIETFQSLSANVAALGWTGSDERSRQTMSNAKLRPKAERHGIVDHFRQFYGTKADVALGLSSHIRAIAKPPCSVGARSPPRGGDAVVASLRDAAQIALAEALAHKKVPLRQKVGLSARHRSRLFSELSKKLLTPTRSEYRILDATIFVAQTVIVDRRIQLGEPLFDLLLDDPSEAGGLAKIPENRNRG